MYLIRQIISVFSASVFLAACSNNALIDEDIPIAKNTWKIGQKITFNKEITDTLSTYNFYLNLRTTKSYEYSNIYIFFDIEFPDGRSSRDTIECPLAYPDGTWIGKSSGSLIENKILFKTKVIFPLSGNYKFSIEHAMRNDDLEEITDVGLCIQKTK